jgi:hypothetical protein
MPRQQLGQELLVDRHLAPLQYGELLLIVVEMNYSNSPKSYLVKNKWA